MALSIELWSGGRLTDGVEEWWDAVEAAFPDDGRTRFPLVSRIDPYGDTAFSHAELRPLANELIELSTLTPDGPLELLTRLITLCEKGSALDDAELRVVGD